MSYLTFGADVQTVVIVNLDTTSKFTQAVCTVLPCRISEWSSSQDECLGAIPVLARNPAVCPAPALPGRANHGERPLRTQREAECRRQVAEELLPVLHRGVLRWAELLRCR